MPQLDILGFSNQLITLIITMGVLYYMVNKYLIPTVGSIAIVRELKTIAGKINNKSITTNTTGNLEIKLNKKMKTIKPSTVTVGNKRVEEVIVKTLTEKIDV
jgi:hypothetical protein